MAELTGTGEEITLEDSRTRLNAPGLIGRATSGTVELTTLTGKLFHQALANSGLTPVVHILLTHRTSATGDVQVTAPAPADGNNAVLLVHDADGAVSWHRPVVRTAAAREFLPAAGDAVGALVDGLSFHVPAARFSTAQTGLLGRAERAIEDAAEGMVKHFGFHPGLSGSSKVLSVLEYPIGHLIGNTGSELFHRWELNKHPYVLRWFPAAQGLPVGEPLTPTNWYELDQRRTLLLVHGIFSTSSGAFGSIDGPTWEELRERYGNRIIGFDHPTASVGVDANAQWFLDQVPDRVTLDLDIICHSRGGLVARSLARQARQRDAQQRDAKPVAISNIVFAATPNGGSEITDSAKWSALINRITSLLTLPVKVIPVPVEAISGALAGVLEIVKLLAVDTALDLPGLEDMLPGSDLLKELAQAAGPTPQYFAIAADFEPGSVLHTLFDGLDDKGRVVDAVIFPKVRNDVAVPTNGVWDPANPNNLDPPPDAAPIPGLPVEPADHRLAIGPGDKIWHSTYFTDPDVWAALLRWLDPPR